MIAICKRGRTVRDKQPLPCTPVQRMDNALPAFGTESWASACGAVFNNKVGADDPVYFVADELRQCPKDRT